ncbi:MAG: ABC transporter ATP-binding protein [Ardenticatenaceae bacterium]|nr:ABC transporter ATP-binding protein [Ardenticatenaceae bacterium]MCB8988339.1 ABC transporter ATP-binding protein [Ardenticatenaceae bacterium]
MAFHGGGWFAYLSHDEAQDRPTITRDLLARVWEFARPYRGQVFLLLITILVITGLSLLSPLLIRTLIDTAIPDKNYHLLNLVALGMVLIPLLNGVIGVWQRNLNSQIGEGVIFDLRCALYTHLQHMSLRFFTQTRTGELMSRLNNDVIGAQQAISNTTVTIVSNIVSLVATLGIMLALEWRLTLLALAILPLFVLPARRIGRILRDLRRRSMEHNAEMNATMNETLNVSGALLVKLFGREQREVKRFSHDAAEVRDIGIRSAVIGRWFFMLLSVVSAVGVAAVYWVGGLLVLQGAFTIGTIVAFGAYLNQLYGPLMSLTNAPVEFAQSMVSFERVFEALDIPVEIQEKAEAVSLEQVNGRLQFQDVSFTYVDAEKGQIGLQEVARFNRFGGEAYLKRGKQRENGEEEAEETAVAPVLNRWALQDINFTIQPGQLAALVGPSGAGKTTITYLIPRLYDPTNGRILLDGQDVKDLTLHTLADNIGMVTQETYLFYDTIRANLLYANPDASEAQLVAAAQAANIHDFIVGLPDGYDTVVGERGYRLSGGERQRIAIARVILKDPRILVLDEATSHLDSLSEALIQEALQRVMKGRTSLVIAHRLSTILAADVILVMEKGELVEQGTHESLLAQGGLYASLYETQFKPKLGEETAVTHS